MRSAYRTTSIGALSNCLKDFTTQALIQATSSDEMFKKSSFHAMELLPTRLKITTQINEQKLIVQNFLAGHFRSPLTAQLLIPLTHNVR